MIPSRRPMIQEKRHRLPRQYYQGEVTVAFTACLEGGEQRFTDAQIVTPFIERLQTAVGKHQCIVYIYCFMPEHQHLIVRGTSAQADTWRAMVDYKQLTGFWLERQSSSIQWQKDFYDHIIRADEDLGAQIRYVAENPVRRGLVKTWHEYPFTGAIGIDLATVMADTASL
jgi:REP element-mobilizing transposase RayT